MSVADTGLRLSLMDAAVQAIAPTGVPIALVPVVKVISGMLYKLKGSDRSKIVTKAVLIIGALHGLKFLWCNLDPIVMPSLTSSITLCTDSQLGVKIVDWLSQRTRGSQKRHITLNGDDKRLLSGNWNTSGQYSSAKYQGWKMFHGFPLYVSTEDEKIPQGQDVSGRVVEVTQTHITITAVGPSRVLDQLIKEALAVIDPDENRYTRVYIATTSPRGGTNWECKSGSSMSRPMETIELEQSLKKDFMDDVHNFISTSRQRYYANRGIPWKRGYMIFGPPGTGKSSLAFASAGMIGSNLFRASMAQIDSEGTMSSLFRRVTQGDILLLEDIDSAGISREAMKDADSNSDKAGKKGISLSGLLNAIDDLAEGFILMMTSNSPESLDRALIRPGRVDRQIFMGNASPELAKSMFQRMYSDDDAVIPVSSAIIQLSEQFAQKIPDAKLTPAEIQGFLLQNTPEFAVLEADNWAQQLVESKEKGLNIVGVKADDEALGIKKPSKDAPSAEQTSGNVSFDKVSESESESSTGDSTTTGPSSHTSSTTEVSEPETAQVKATNENVDLTEDDDKFNDADDGAYTDEYSDSYDSELD